MSRLIWKSAFAIALLSAGLGATQPSSAQQVAGSVEAGLQALAQNLLASAPAERRPALSVLPFPGADQSCPVLSVFVVDELTTTLITSVQPRPRVVERQQLEAIIAQNRLDEFMTDPEQRKRLGGLSGIGAVILGTFVGIGDRLRINARMVAIDTGETIGAASVSVPRTRDMEELLRQGSGRGVNCLSDVRPAASGGAAAGAARLPAPAGGARTGDQNCVQQNAMQACLISATATSSRWLSVVLRFTNTGREDQGLLLVGPAPEIIATDGTAPNFARGHERGIRICDNLRAEGVAQCLEQTHPDSWTRVGAQASTNVILWWVGGRPLASAAFNAAFAVRPLASARVASAADDASSASSLLRISLSDLRVSQARD